MRAPEFLRIPLRQCECRIFLGESDTEQFTTTFFKQGLSLDNGMAAPDNWSAAFFTMEADLWQLARRYQPMEE